MLDAETIQAALLAAAGELQALMNHQGLAARSAHTAKVLFESDLRASLRRALQFGRAELVAVETNLGDEGILSRPTDVVVSARTRLPQLAIELQLHPRGEDHAGFATSAIGAVAKMALARSRESVEQASVLIGAPPRFWRWLPGYAEERLGYDLLAPEPGSPVSANGDFLGGPTWDPLFDSGMDESLPERLWTALMAGCEVRSPWLEFELRMIEVKGLGTVARIRGT
jgi:hypothetical protein